MHRQCVPLKIIKPACRGKDPVAEKRRLLHLIIAGTADVSTLNRADTAARPFSATATA
jgi:hypothetical protein